MHPISQCGLIVSHSVQLRSASAEAHNHAIMCSCVYIYQEQNRFFLFFFWFDYIMFLVVFFYSLLLVVNYLNTPNSPGKVLARSDRYFNLLLPIHRWIEIAMLCWCTFGLIYISIEGERQVNESNKKIGLQSIFMTNALSIA